MFLLVDKPKGMTSHDVVSRVREISGERRVGHAGTLDPIATGLLIVGIGRESTKKLGVIAKGTKKTYFADIVLGEERDTDDREGVVVSKAKGVLSPTRDKITRTVLGFKGEQLQVPPKYSAIKVSGKKAYELARKGKKVNLKARKIRIYSIKLLDYRYPLVKIEAEVSAGTYVRALARDIGRKLGMGGYLSELRRTKIGEYSLRDAVSLEKLTGKNWKRFAI